MAYKRRRTGAFIPGVDRTGGFYGRYSGRNAELKFHDVDLDDVAVSAAATVTATINIIPQGVTESQRVGRKCTIKSINWRYRLGLPELDAGGTAPSSDTVRVILFLDKQANGATAAATDMLESDDWQSFRNLSNSGRFNFLLDKTVNLNYANLASDGAGVVSSGNMFKDFSFYKTCDIPIEFSSTTGAIGEIRSNNLGVMLVGAQDTAIFASKIRLRFSDQ